MERIEKYLRIAAERVLGLHAHVRSVNQNVTPSIWFGPGRDAWGARLDARRRAMEPLPGSFTSAADQIKKYRLAVVQIDEVVKGHEGAIAEVAEDAGGVEWLTEVRRGWCDHERRFEVDSFSIGAALEGGVDVRGPGVSSEMSDGCPGRVVRTVADAQEWAEFVNAEIRALARAVHEQGEVRRAADNSLRDALAPVKAIMAAERAQYAAAGITNPRDMTPRKYAAEIAGQATDDFSGPGGDYRAGQMTLYLKDFFDQYGDDPVMMDAFYDALDGEGVVRVVEMIGSGEPNPTTDRPTAAERLAVARQLREGLATVSQTWGREKAEAFTESMFGTPPESEADTEQRVAAITFLFSGDPVGERLALAAANKVDELVRLEGTPPILRPRTDGRPLNYTGATALLAMEAPTFEISGIPVPMFPGVTGVVLDQLAEYPDATLEWMYDGGSRERVDYWFGELSWGNGYETPVALLAGVQEATGNPPYSTYDAEVWEHVAAVSGWSFQGLAENPNFTVETISPEASAVLAGMIAGQLPQAMHTTVGPNAVGANASELKDGFVKVDCGWGEKRPVMAVDAVDYTNVMLKAVVHEDGRLVLEQYLDLTGTQQVVPGVGRTPLEFAEFAGAVTGLAHGASGAADVERAVVADEQAQVRVDALATAAAAVPLPGAGSVTGVVASELAGWLQNMAVTMAVTDAANGVAGSGAAPGAWSTNHEALALENEDARRDALRREAEDQMRTQIDQWKAQGVSLGASEDEVMGRFLSQWDLHYNQNFGAQADG